jgi:hypothetical protein
MFVFSFTLLQQQQTSAPARHFPAPHEFLEKRQKMSLLLPKPSLEGLQTSQGRIGNLPGKGQQADLESFGGTFQLSLRLICNAE